MRDVASHRDAEEHQMHQFVTLDDVSPAALRDLLAQTRTLKYTRGASQTGAPLLGGRTIALLFEKPSLRTRVSFEVAARELGANTLYLSADEVRMGQREPVADVARVLSSYVHAAVLRTFEQSTIEEFARYASVPVINGLSGKHHPCQALADVFTITEELRETSSQTTIAYIGDGNNVAHSLMQAAIKMGWCIRLATPPGFEPDAALVSAARREALVLGANLTLTSDPQSAAEGADVLYTDVWTSMGQEGEAEKRRALFAPYRIDDRLLALAAPHAIVLHPLPAHRGEEIAAEVLDGPQSRVFAQAENRLHAQKALLRTLLAADARASRSA
jgi:ornithine carbamoyltransferase